MGTNIYYITSKYRNPTNRRISEVSRSDPFSKKQTPVGPADYKPIDSINPVGRYSVSKHSSASSCVFPKSER